MFNQSLKRIRKSANKTQAELAKRLNISPQSVSKWESGEALPSIAFLPEMADFFNCCVNTFFSEYELNIYEKLNEQLLDEKAMIDFLINIYNSTRKSLLKTEEDPDFESDIPTESLFTSTVYEFLKETDIISCSKLQRKLGTGYLLSVNIIDALVKMGIIKKTEGGYSVLSDKVDLLLPYFS